MRIAPYIGIVGFLVASLSLVAATWPEAGLAASQTRDTIRVNTIPNPGSPAPRSNRYIRPQIAQASAPPIATCPGYYPPVNRWSSAQPGVAPGTGYAPCLPYTNAPVPTAPPPMALPPAPVPPGPTAASCPPAPSRFDSWGAIGAILRLPVTIGRYLLGPCLG